MNEKLKDFEARDLRRITDTELERLKNLPDDELLRAAGTLDAFAIVESNRRLKNALHGEESRIKVLTVVIVILTVILVIFTGVLVAIGLEPWWKK